MKGKTKNCTLRSLAVLLTVVLALTMSMSGWPAKEIAKADAGSTPKHTAYRYYDSRSGSWETDTDPSESDYTGSENTVYGYFGKNGSFLGVGKEQTQSVEITLDGYSAKAIWNGKEFYSSGQKTLYAAYHSVCQQLAAEIGISVSEVESPSVNQSQRDTMSFVTFNLPYYRTYKKDTHEMTLVSVKKATATEDGMMEHYVDNVCGDGKYYDQNGNEVTEESLNIPAFGVPSPAGGLTYSGSDQKLSDESSIDTGKVSYYYSLDKETYSSSVKAKDAGTYKVYYYAALDGDEGSDIYSTAGYTKNDGKSFSVRIAKKSMKAGDVVISDPADAKYDGEAKEPEVSVSDSTGTLKEGKDYELSYEDNIYPGTGAVTVIGKGNYKHKVTKYFTITEDPVPVVTSKGRTVCYNGNEVKPAARAEMSDGSTFEGEFSYSYKKEGDEFYSEGLPKDAGTYTVKIEASQNGYVSYADAEIVILPKSLESADITADGPEDVTYNGSWQTPEIAVTDTGIADTGDGDFSQELEKDKDYRIEYSNNKNAGRAFVTITGKGNYIGKLCKGFNIEKAALTVKAKDADIRYGEAPKNEGITSSGLFGSDTLDDFDGKIVYDIDYSRYGDVGTYHIDISGSTLSNDNYKVRYENGKLKVRRLAAVLSWTAPENLVYDGSEKIPSVRVANTVNGDKVSVSANLTKGCDNVKPGKFTFTVESIDNDNYKLKENVTSPEYEITKAQPKADVTGENLTYNGKEQALVKTENVSDDCTVYYTLDEDPKKDAGTNWQTGIPKGKKAGEYTVSYYIHSDSDNFEDSDVRSVKVRIEPKEITAALEAEDSVYGDVKAPACTLEGVEEGDDVKAVLSYSGTAAGGTVYEGSEVPEKAGNYKAAVSIEGSDSENYVLKETAAEFAVKKASLKVTAGDKTIVYGEKPDAGEDPDLKYSGFVNGDTESVLKGKAEYSYGYRQYEDAGGYDIHVSGLSSDDYDIEFVKGTLLVTQKEITVSINPGGGTYGDVKEASAKLLGTVHDDDPNVTLAYRGKTNGGKDYDSSKVPGEAGNYTVTASLGEGSNYKLTGSVTEPFIVDRADPALKTGQTAYQKTYEDGAFALDVSSKGGGEITFESSNTEVLSVDGKGNVTLNGAGEAVITVTCGETDNYRSGIARINVTVAKHEGRLSAEKTSYTITYSDEEEDRTNVLDLSKLTKKGDDDKVTYASDNDPVASVDENGKVTVNGAGKAVITIVKEEGRNYTKAKETVTVNVLKAEGFVSIANDLTKTYDRESVLDPIISTTTECNRNDIAVKYKKKGAEESSYDAAKPKDAGDYTVRVSVPSDENHKACEIEADFTIGQKQLTQGNLQKIADQTYDGTAKKPSVTLKDGDSVLEKGKDYTVNGYSDNVKAGTAKVTVTGKGNYCGSVTGSFKIKYDKAKYKSNIDSGLKETVKSKNAKVSWGEVKGADGYEVYFVKCGRNFKSKPAKTLKGAAKTSVTISGTNSKYSYKAYVKAYTKNNGKKVYLAKSHVVHAAGSKSSVYINAKSIKGVSSSYTLKKGKTKNLKAKVVPARSGKKTVLYKNHTSFLKYWSSDESVAKVSGKGKITAKKAGTCKVYVMAPNGVKKKITIKVS